MSAITPNENPAVAVDSNNPDQSPNSQAVKANKAMPANQSNTGASVTDGDPRSIANLVTDGTWSVLVDDQGDRIVFG